MRTLGRSVEFGLLAVGFLLASAAHAQQRIPTPAARRRAMLPVQRVSPAPAGAQSRIADLPQNWVEQLQEMTPAEQQQFLRNNARFRNLPAQRQAVIRRRLREWNSLPLDQREALLERQQIWEQLPPEQRRQVRESLLPRWQSLPLPRRQVIMGKLRVLRGLDGEQRGAKLSDENFLENMNAEERQMLFDLSNLGVGQSAG
jgi:Protein of unknown function (DUF3106)